MTPDLAARRLILASYLYYNHAVSMVSDAAFDATCKLVARDWAELAPIRQFQLGSPDEILASGHHIQITLLGEAAARAWHMRKFNVTLQPERCVREWLWHEQFQCRFGKLTG